jgi:hypothetical protein
MDLLYVPRTKIPARFRGGVGSPWSDPNKTPNPPWTKAEDKIFIQMRAEHQSLDAIAARLDRGYNTVQKHNAKLCELGLVQATKPEKRARSIPNVVLEDRTARLLASERMSLTAFQMGDPPPGYSAADRRGM